MLSDTSALAVQSPTWRRSRWSGTSVNGQGQKLELFFFNFHALHIPAVFVEW